MSIRIQNLSKKFGKQFALQDVSFHKTSNGIIGFLGPNGAGKSTTMKTLAGIIPIESGQCWIEEINIQQNSLESKKNIGYLPENNPLYLDMYVGEILEFQAALYNLDNVSTRIKDVVKKTGLVHEQHKKIKELSKGYRQRVGLACAIIHNPKVLILDEPTTGLDPNQIIEIRQLIRDLSKEKTVLLSTHLMQEVEAICDEIIVIHQGKIKDQFLLRDKNSRYPNLSMEEIFVQLTK
ncbi:ATP-binding cassette domain-containing protein [Sphingobacterium bovistauri]|uniref:ATP-binding cassette domain-containing protein n=1 Tax=Sphingobacterium bovistauri TaxID=2781959 RepID=A0ABS7Z9I6_9SPHI|nr:ATP-binding cassette domain-containing protein [Sphingobacterium bovistauri]MCA5006056.1 ATP-binding cassette domain-containing protein [Sphingobacterium bovistauri]